MTTHALQCRNGHRYSTAGRIECPECGDESFELVVVTDEAEARKDNVVESTDGSVVAIHKQRGTGYIRVEPGGGGMATVTTEAGSKYVVHGDSIEYLE